jgi:hypothetical protein
MIAAGDAERAIELLAAGAGPDRTNDAGGRAADIAREHGNDELAAAVSART